MSEQKSGLSHQPAEGGAEKAAWIPVGEQLPEHGMPVLITWSSGNQAVAVRRGRFWRDPHSFDRDEEFMTPSHWMPLPAPPAKRAGIDAKEQK